MKANRKLASIKQQAAGTTVLSVAFLALAGWLWSRRTDFIRIAAIIVSIWGTCGVFFGIRTYLRAQRSNQHRWGGGDENL